MANAPRFGFGDVVLVPFPFTDQSGTKKRPAVVVSSSSYNASRRDIVITTITSQVRQPLAFGEALVADWQAAGLIKQSVLKPVFTTIEHSTSSSAPWAGSPPPMPRRCARSSAMSSAERLGPA